jgi:hypothetical protein
MATPVAASGLLGLSLGNWGTFQQVGKLVGKAQRRPAGRPPGGPRSQGRKTGGFAVSKLGHHKSPLPARRTLAGSALGGSCCCQQATVSSSPPLLAGRRGSTASGRSQRYWRAHPSPMRAPWPWPAQRLPSPSAGGCCGRPRAAPVSAAHCAGCAIGEGQAQGQRAGVAAAVR